MTKAEVGRHELPPRLDRAEQLRWLDGQRVRVVGTYLSVPSLKRMPRPGRLPEYVDLGEVVIQIEGSSEAYDPAAGDTPARIGLGMAARPSDEIVRLNDRRVFVEGRIVLRPEMASTHRSAVLRPSQVLQDPTGLRLDE
ncbi:MAG: hypothetical protein V5B44_14395 [Candidatus Accumulibacter necessarius]|jgi:hypothetical protein|uniref:hypothetical protein n=1 Tax=Candidatus Accumulibacter necessarius TaxID=2954386 RepID=UPI002FC2BB74